MNLKEPVPKSMGEVVTAGLRFVSYKTGIIRAVVEQPIEQDDPLVFSFGTLMSDTSRYSEHQCSVRNGGAGITRDQALVATIGEAIERYCSNFYCREDLILASYGDLATAAVPPEDFILFSDSQHCQDGFPFEKFTRASKVCWTWGYSLVQRKPKLVPACFTYLPYALSPGESLIGPSISTGLACAASVEEAILMGIYECVERDAFTIMWLNKLSMPVVDMRSSQSGVARLFHEKIAISKMDFCISDITSDIGIPTFYTLALGESTVGRLACVGSASRLHGEEAIQKTLVECAQGRPYLRYLLRKERDWACGTDFCNVRSFNDHARLYSTLPELISNLEFVRDGPARSLADVKDLSSGSVMGDIDVCVNKLVDKGFDIVIIDLTTREVAAIGFKVVRVIIPGLQPLHGDHLFRFLGGKRLYEVPRTLGYAEQDTTEEGLYAMPHPFP